MLNPIKPALIMLLALTVLTGVIYPALVTLYAQTFFKDQASGSLLYDAQSVPNGSQLIGQAFTNPKYFWGRPSATQPFPYNAAASSGSNLGPTNPALLALIKARIAAFQAADPDNHFLIPIDLVTASASGLDPHISPAAAHYQVSRIARLNQISPKRIQKLVDDLAEARQWGILGEPRVNVLLLNRALTQLVATNER